MIREVMGVQERPNLFEGVCHSRAPAQPGCRRLGCHRCAFSNWGVDLSRVCSYRYCKPVRVPAVPESLPLLGLWGTTELLFRCSSEAFLI